MDPVEPLDSIQVANARAREALQKYLLNDEDGWPDAHIFAALQAQQASLHALEQSLSPRPGAPPKGRGERRRENSRTRERSA